MGYSDSFWGGGDYGGTNSTNTLTHQIAFVFNTPALVLLIESSWYVTMQFGHGTPSDEIIKTNIKRIGNALDKTLILRGVEYNDIRIEPERKGIGLMLI